ncbi:hypothetical protein [Blastochloris sulfoviridis]|uniref:Uncharacterized protein n=1 Tax=Blastochloris sulfoviridis TaxID=50712 RepID=A0A5M6HI10_9HYPH|nr:hypothetical protein [Blastochloris sulfoviridis]KAA5595500.1 hypothetical protein F1193_16575 [Blastochloris sulfoviridis]
MKPSDPARKRHVIDPPDPSWVPLRAAPFLFQTSLGTPGPFVLRPAPQKSIDEFVQQQVRCHDVLGCGVDRHSYCLVIKYPVAAPDGDGWAADEVYPYDVRQQYMSPDGIMRPGCEDIVAAIESVWDRLVVGFRRAVTRGYCRVNRPGFVGGCLV